MRLEQIPILQLGEFLLVTIQVELHDDLAMALQNDLTTKLAKTSARGVLLDISALEIVDSFIGRSLAQISSIARVMDATMVLVGMRPAVAITLVELGMTLSGITTALNVDKGMQMLRTSLNDPGGALSPT
jgi:rsbT antagonist protein RsbS